MSFILDALKKSESERQRQNAPGIASIPHGGKQQGKPRWPWLVVGLLLINLGVLAVIMVQPEVVPVAGESKPAMPAEQAPGSFSEIVREAKRTTPNLPAAPTATPQQESAVEEFAPASTAPAPQQTITAGLPTFNDLRASGQLQLPDMHLDIHVYSGRPADRFVFVNMSKYKESATLSEGPRVSEIVPDGVVLDYMGTRFLLPRE